MSATTIVHVGGYHLQVMLSLFVQLELSKTQVPSKFAQG